MRPFRLGLLAALLAAFLMPAAATLAAEKAPARAHKGDQLQRGAAEAPAAVQGAAVPCTVSGAAWIGSAPADKKTNTPAKDLYEVACTGSMGFIIQTVKGGGEIQAFS